MTLIVIECTGTSMDGKWIDTSQLAVLWGRELPVGEHCVATGYFEVRADGVTAEVYVPREQLGMYVERQQMNGIYKLSDFLRAVKALGVTY